MLSSDHSGFESVFFALRELVNDEAFPRGGGLHMPPFFVDLPLPELSSEPLDIMLGIRSQRLKHRVLLTPPKELHGLAPVVFRIGNLPIKLA